MGLTLYLVPLLVAPFYFASSENRWAEILQPYIKSWLVPKGEENIRAFFEGLPPGASIPWGTWIKPLILWLPFLLALYIVMIALVVIFRKQWVEKECLNFPLTKLVGEMVNNKLFFKERLLWLGFSVPFVVGSFRALHNYFPVFPYIELYRWFPAFRGTINFPLWFSFAMTGFAYFINLNLCFSIWFFILLRYVLQGWFNITGIRLNEILDIYSQKGGGPIFSHVQFGALLVLVGFMFWTARAHLKEVWYKAVRNDSKIDDSGEILSYRGAVLSIGLGLLVMVLWLRFTGLSFWLATLFLLLALFVFLGITRIVIEGGVAIARTPMLASTAIISGIGSSIGPEQITSLGLTQIYHGDIRTFVMASAAHNAKLFEGRKNLRPLFWIFLLAIIITLVGSIGTTLILAYRHGAINANQWFFIDGPRGIYNYVAEKIKHPTGPFIPGLWLTLLGGGLMWFLSFMHYRFLWWPLHPLGLPICGVALTRYLWFSFFIAWLIKGMVLRYGGSKLYLKSQTIFLGFILGQFFTAGFWLIIDFFTKQVGNVIFSL